MTEPVEKTYYMPVYERCPTCGGSGIAPLKSGIHYDLVCQCGGRGFVKMYISLAEWAAQTRERVLNIPRNPRSVIDSVVTKGCL